MGTETIFFVIIMIVVGIIRWLAQNNSKADQNDPTIWKDSENDFDSQPHPMSPSTKRDLNQWQSRKNNDDERVKQFMEALGLPQTANQPPQRQPMPQPIQRQEPPPLMVNPPVYVPQISEPETPSPLSPLAKRSPLTTKPAQTIRAEIPPLEAPKQYKSADWRIEEAAKAAALKKRTAAADLAKIHFNLGLLLASGDGIRAGIMLNEILGKPRGLQSFDQVATFH